MLYLNAQSIVRKVDELACVANDLDPDLILITETWCNSEISDAYLAIEGYELQPDLRRDREDTEKGRGGGLLVYSKKGLAVCMIPNTADFSQYCTFRVHDITVYLVYRSPNSPQVAMESLANLVRSVPKGSVIIGDFNLPDVNWVTGESSRRAAGFLEAVEEAMLDQLVTFPTQVRGNVLDLVLTNIPERVVEVCEGGRLGQSDHEMVSVKVSCGAGRVIVKEVKNWRRAKWDEMREDMAKVNWRREFNGKNANQMWDTLKSKIHKVVKNHVPTRRVKNGGRPAWMRRELMAAIRKKRRLWKAAKNGGSMEEYREEDKKVKKQIRKAKRDMEKKLAQGNDGNKRPFYAYVKRKTKSRPTVGPLKDGQGRTVEDDEEMAEELNKYFSSVFTREAGGEIPEVKSPREAKSMAEVRITEWEVKKIIGKLRKEAAAGPDDIGPRLLQELMNEVAGPLTMIFRCSLEQGIVPEDWKVANVTPIFKKGAKSSPGNYRPVSLTSVCCKIMETVLRDKMMKHLLENELISPSQHGFMSGKSCTTNLLEFLEEVTKSVDEGSPMDIVFLDFAKAFDKVPMRRLLAKVKANGIRGRTWEWIRQWLTGRKQRVVLNGKCSTWKEVLSGVPQGSVLGPILFLIFINDLDGAAKLVTLVRKFADDTKLGQKVETEEGRENLQKTLDELVEWAGTWGMEFNVQKCKVMHVGHGNVRQQYTMGGHNLESVDEEKDVGVKWCKNLKPSAQCSQAAKTAQLVLSQITRAFHYRDRHIFVRLYTQYVRPHLEFCTPVWSPWSGADKECLERVQRRAVGMVSGLVSQNYEERLTELGLTTLEERRHQIDMLQVYKVLNGKDKVQSENWFVMAANGERATRAAADPLNLRIPAPRLEVRRHFFTQRVPEPWNKIPAALKSAATVDGFRRGYKDLRRGGRVAAQTGAQQR